MLIFADRLKEMRKKISLTQKVVAEAVSISERNYISLENNNSNPNCETLIALADYFGVSIDYLVGRSNNPTRY